MQKSILKRPTVKLIVGVLLAVGFIIWNLAIVPPRWVQEWGAAWILVRLIVAVVAFCLAYLSFTSGELLLGKKQLELERKYRQDKNDGNLKGLGYSGLDIWLIESPLTSWCIWWILLFQVMVSFYINDWCRTGF
jgi:hypothetical protein